METSNFEDVKIQMEPNFLEEKYTQENEDLLEEWLVQAKEASVAHNAAGRKFKFKHELFGLPAAAIPIAYSPVAGLFSANPGIQYANAFVLVTTGLLSCTYTFFNFGKKSQQHFDYEARYADLATTIQVELAKKREIRIRADRFIEMIQSKIDGLGANAPLL